MEELAAHSTRLRLTMCRYTTIPPHPTHRPATAEFLGKEFSAGAKRRICGIKTCPGPMIMYVVGVGGCGRNVTRNGVTFAWISCKFNDMARYSGWELENLNFHEFFTRQWTSCCWKWKLHCNDIEGAEYLYGVGFRSCFGGVCVDNGKQRGFLWNFLALNKRFSFSSWFLPLLVWLSFYRCIFTVILLQLSLYIQDKYWKKILSI